jgi:hypothetical protein
MNAHSASAAEKQFLIPKSFDHAMFMDATVKPTMTYYYRVCAVNTTGQRGAYSEEARVTTKPEKKGE